MITSIHIADKMHIELRLRWQSHGNFNAEAMPKTKYESPLKYILCYRSTNRRAQTKAVVIESNQVHHKSAENIIGLKYYITYYQVCIHQSSRGRYLNSTFFRYTVFKATRVVYAKQAPEVRRIE